jgi:hypothetical protein
MAAPSEEKLICDKFNLEALKMVRSMTGLNLTLRSQPSPLVRSMTRLNLTMRSQPSHLVRSTIK